MQLINSSNNYGGIYRALLIDYDGDLRIYVPGLHSGDIDLNNLDKYKFSLPKPIWNVPNLEAQKHEVPTHPCWVTFENGDSKRPIIMGWLGKGIMYSVNTSSSSSNTTSNTTANPTSNITTPTITPITTPITITEGANILLVAGHGAGDPGASGNRYNEADLTREVVSLLSSKITCDVYDTNKNMFTELKNGADSNFLGKYDYVIEVHFNAFDSSAHGTELLVKSTSSPTSMESKVLEALASIGFKNRGFKDGNWLQNLNKSYNAGCKNYFLIEVCFIDNSSDINKYQTYKSELIDAIAAAINSVAGQNNSVVPTGIGTVDVNTKIMGNCVATYNQMISYLRSINLSAPDYVNHYINEGAAEGVRGDIAFAQSCVETGHWTFTGDVTPDQNNFAGIGTTGGGVKSNYFDTPQIGIRAQIQHLKAYASTDSLNGECVDPRFSYVTRGCATRIGDFGGGKWASDSSYASKIINILNKILEF